VKYTLRDRYDFRAGNFFRAHESMLAYDLGWCTDPPLGFDATYHFERDIAVPVKEEDIPLDLDGLDPPQQPETEGETSVRRSFDPNDKIGSAGIGPANYIDAGQLLLYTVFFENDPQQATAPAQRVIIDDQLDSDLDWSTFELGEFAFGAHRSSAPEGLRDYTFHVDTTNLDGSPLRVTISGGINLNTGLVTWVFDSIDPETGAPPNDPDAGFLPVNDETHRGEGHVTFLVRPKSDLPLGTQIHNQASIFFDSNPPINTPVTLHTIGHTVIYLPSVLRNYQ